MSSGNETEEIHRAFPPPGYRLSTRCRRRSSSRSSESTILHSDYEARPSSLERPRTRPTSTVPVLIQSRPQLDGHDSSAEHRNRRACATREREREISVQVRHYCARCGRARSRRFQQDNPVDTTKDPYPGICSRCETPGGFVSASRRKGPIVVDEEMEEVLIRRKRGNAFTDLFQPRSVDEIRVRRRTDDRRREEERPRQCSDDRTELTRVQVRRSSEDLRGRQEKQGPLMSNRVCIRVRSTSRTREEPQPEEIPKPLMLREDVHYRIASHPRAWSHGRMVTVLRPVRPCTPPPVVWIEPPEPQPPARPPSPPEWYYRRVRRVAGPIRQVRDQSRPDTFEDRNANFDTEPARQPRMLPGSRLQEGHRHGKSPMVGGHRHPIRSAIQHAWDDWDNRHNDLYEADREKYRSSRLRGRSPSDDQRDRHVRFAPGTKRRNTNGRRQAEADNDFEQERDDQKEYNYQKKKVHQGVHKGGGKYELYDVDGHYSDDGQPRGKQYQRRKKPAKPLYTKRDERAEGVLSWTDLLRGMDS